MLYYTIAPLKYLRLVERMKRHLVVAPYMENADFRSFYVNIREKGAQIILDNGAYEFGKAMDDSQYVRYALMLKPELLVLPDVFREGRATINRVEGFLDLLDSENLSAKFKFMGVPQGKTLEEWMWCYHKLIQYCDVIGLPCAQWKDNTGALRVFFAKNLDEMDIPKIHLLGLWSAKELSAYTAGDERIISIDTSMPFKLASRSETLNSTSKGDFKMNFDMVLDKEQEQIAKSNLTRMQEMIEGGKQ